MWPHDEGGPTLFRSPSRDLMKLLRLSPTPSSVSFGRRDLLRWIFLGRLTLAAGIFVGVVLVWGRAQPDQTLIATVLFILALLVTGASFWWLVVLEGEPGENFSYGQIIFDALLVTGIVHITGGGESVFAPVYILVVTAGALLLPLRGGILLAILASILYLGDALWLHEEALTATLVLQLGLFALVALVTGWVGDRLRRAGVALGEVESELRQLQLDTSDILENVATGVLTVDGEGRMVYLNRAGEFLLGVDRKQWMGAPVLDVMEETAPGLGSLLHSSLENQVAFSRLKATTHQDGEEVTLGVSTTILDREGDGDPDSDPGPSVTALFQDISDQEELDALNWRNARLEAVAELSASLAHEIKNPLASIRSAVEQLTRPTLDESDRGTLRDLVVRESDRLSRLLSEFIEFSAVRMGSSEAVDLSALVQEAVAVVRQHPDSEKEVEIVCSGLGEPLFVAGDTDLLHRAVFNLVLNAVQFSEPGGEVNVALKTCAPGSNPRSTGIEDALRLSVRDRGPGVDPEEIGRIFDPFFTTRTSGSGLGLAMVHRAVEAHEGAVFVDQPPDGGTDFVIYLPGRGEAPVP